MRNSEIAVGVTQFKEIINLVHAADSSNVICMWTFTNAALELLEMNLRRTQ